METCGSIIFTNRVYSFQYPICKEKIVVSGAFPPIGDSHVSEHIAGTLLSISGSYHDAELIKTALHFPEACCLCPKVRPKVAADEQNTKTAEVAEESKHGINTEFIKCC